MTPTAAKLLVAAELKRLGIPYTKLTARTVGFVDLTRSSCVFVRIYGWKPHPALEEIQEIARKNGFRVDTDWGLG